MTRLDSLQQWLDEVVQDTVIRIEPASSDASFRRYFRVYTQAQGSLIAMDAPPEHEDCAPFVHVAGVFGAAGVNVPVVLAENLADGFLLLTDLGRTTYLEALKDQTADALYLPALDALVDIQRATQPGVLPPYDDALLTREMQLFPDWYVSTHFQHRLTSAQTEMLSVTFARLNTNILAQPQVFVHRDYHSRNLMVTDPLPGILDFQDAVVGAITYDLVSLFKDAYITWEEARVIDWTVRYWERARAAGLPVASDFGEFYRDFEWMGIQRHLKVLGIFARLYHRDGKAGYLNDMPRVLSYLRKACERYSEFTPLLDFLDQLDHDEPAVRAL